MTFTILSAALASSAYLTLIAAAYLGVASACAQESRCARMERAGALAAHC